LGMDAEPDWWRGDAERVRRRGLGPLLVSSGSCFAG